jgi:hypothetical protein
LAEHRVLAQQQNQSRQPHGTTGHRRPLLRRKYRIMGALSVFATAPTEAQFNDVGTYPATESSDASLVS